MSGGGIFDIEITGRGAHGALPETGIDPVVIAAHVVTALQSVVARNVAALDSAVVSVTQIHAGDAYNIIPDTAVLRALRLEGRAARPVAASWAPGVPGSR